MPSTEHVDLHCNGVPSVVRLVSVQGIVAAGVSGCAVRSLTNWRTCDGIRLPLPLLRTFPLVHELEERLGFRVARAELQSLVKIGSRPRQIGLE